MKSAQCYCFLLMGISVFAAPATSKKASDKFAITDTQFLNYLRPLFASQDVYRVAHSIEGIPFEQQIAILTTIVNNTQLEFSTADKMLLLLLVVAHTKDYKKQSRLLQALTTYPSLIAAIPPLYSASIKVPQVIPAVMRWLKEQPALKKEWVEQAVSYALHENDPHAIQVLKHYKVITLDATHATRYLWTAINKKVDARFIPLLVQFGADVNNHKEGKTPLVQAVLEDAFSHAQELLKAGARVNDFADPAVGTPLQNAIRKGYTPIEMLLRKWGARE